MRGLLLGENDLCESGVRVVVEWLRGNLQLQVLNLDGNGLSDRSGMVLSGLLKSNAYL